jgi:transcriptional regulator with XRE-family HTH domain
MSVCGSAKQPSKKMTSEHQNPNSFGTYLRQLRESRGYSNINEYVRRYNMLISHVHYRHLETGQRKLSIESAKGLCEALEADRMAFYYHFLHDLLPDEVVEFFSHVPERLPEPRQNAVQKTVSKASAYQNALIRTMEPYVLYPDEDSCDYLDKHFDLLPILWFIYSVPQATKKEIDQVADQHHISMPANEIISDFHHLGLVRIDPDSGTIKRTKPSVSFLHSPLGEKILSHQTEGFLRNYDQPRNPTSKDTVMNYGVVLLSSENHQLIFRRIQEFLRDVHKAATDSENEPSDPVFFAITFGQRPEYFARSIEG